MMQSSSSLADMMQERSSLSSSFKKQKTIQTTTTIPKTRSQRRLNRRGEATNSTKAMMMMMKSSGGGGEDVGGEKTSSSSSLESSSKTLMLTTTNSTKTNKRGFMQKRKATMGNGGLRVSAATAMDSFSKFSALFSNLFPLWTVLSAALALTKPAFFNFMTTPMITICLALLMFSMGITLTIDDFLRVFKKPDVIGLGFLYCYVAMPALAFVIGNAIGLSGPLLAGLILVGSINGGQASNLCAYIAKGDVALSVLMTTATTIGCIFMTPLICKLALGAIVDVNAIGMAISTIKVVLVPVVLGVTLNKVTPKTCRTVEPFCPIVGVIMTVILVGGSVAQCAEGILNAGMKLQVGAFLLHLLGGALGYFGMKIFKYSETTCRTCAIETAMKSSAFGFLLASLHFPEFLVRVPSAVSVVWMAIMGSMMAVIWRFIPVEDE
jgi:BASS family bile acid:Na+ symporter